MIYDCEQPLSETSADEAETLAQVISSAPAVLFFSGASGRPGPAATKAIAFAREFEPDLRIYDVSRNRAVRRELILRSCWDFFPQLYAGGEYIGGWAIIPEFFISGEYTRITGRGSPCTQDRPRATAKVWRYHYDANTDLVCGAASDGTVRVARGADEFSSILVASGWVNSAVSSACGSKIYAALTDTTIAVVNLETGQTTARLRGHTRWVNDITIAERLGRAWSVSADRRLIEWDLDSGKSISERHAHTGLLWCAEVDRAANTVATGCADGLVRLWRTGSLEKIVENDLRSMCVTDLCSLPGGFAATTFLGPVYVLDHDLQITTTFAGHTERSWTVASIDEYRLAASSSGDGTVRTWDTSTGRQYHVWRFPQMPIGLAWVKARSSLVVGFADGSYTWLRVAPGEDQPK